jgi:hypothetical protein
MTAFSRHAVKHEMVHACSPTKWFAAKKVKSFYTRATASRCYLLVGAEALSDGDGQCLL